MRNRHLDFTVAALFISGLVVMAVLASNALIPYALGAQVLLVVAIATRADLRSRIFSRPGLIVLAFFLLGVLTCLVSINLPRTVVQVARLWIGVLVFLTVAASATEIARIKALALLLGGAGAGLSVAMPLLVEIPPQNKLFFVPSMAYQAFQPIVADIANPNVLAGTIVLLFPLAISSIFLMRSTWQRILLMMSVAVVGLGLLLLQSRSAILAGVLSVAVVLLMRFRLARSTVWIVTGLITFLVVVDIAVPIQLGSTGTHALSIEGAEPRQRIWRCAWQLLQDFPYTGHGMGLFSEACNMFYPGLLPQADVPHAHALILQIGLDLGVFGVISWLSALSMVVTACVQCWRHGDRDVQLLAAGLLSSQIALLVHGITDSVTWGMVRPAPLVWLIWGLAIGLQRACPSHVDAIQGDGQHGGYR